MKKNLFTLAVLILTAAACSNKNDIKKEVTALLEENPEIILKSIEKHPEKYLETLNKAAKAAQVKMAQQRQLDEKKKLEASFDQPLEPKLSRSIAHRGDFEAPITLVEYSDFQCGFCRKATGVIEKLEKKYGKKIKLVYKHLPLDFHPQAMMAAQYFEAIKLQNMQKAFTFHDVIFKNMSKLGNGEKFLTEKAKELKVDIKRLKKDLNSKVVINQIKEDMREAQQLGFQGTPGFLLNGIPIKGAYPYEHFESIIDELVKRKKLVL